jgi:polyhydroxyalkanoate synthase
LKGKNRARQRGNPGERIPRKPDLESLSQAVSREAIHRLNQFSLGIRKYQNHPRSIRMPDPPVIWSRGSARLLDYGVLPKTPFLRPVLVIPSLINRSYILDLDKKRSLLRHLAAKGMHPFLMDWGDPGPTELGFALEDYINGYLQNALDFICSRSSSRPALVGYCMGGNLALALAQNNQTSISALALLATPWNFHSDDGAYARILEIMAPSLELLITSTNMLPVDMLQAMFASLDPAQTSLKFRNFAEIRKNSAMAKRFVMLEDWVNDGVPLPGSVARECLFGWYRDNSTYKKTWKIGDTIIDPGKISLPTCAAIPAKDHIVPPASARALAQSLPDCHILTPEAGHIGMVAGSKANTQLYSPLSEWLTKQFK